MMERTRETENRLRILVVGGGYVGMYAALRLQKKLRHGEATVTVVDPQPNMTYQPFLPEAAAGSIEARHVVVPLRKVLKKCRVLTGEVSAVDHERRVATVAPPEGEPFELPYDVLVMAPGSVSRTLPVPGLAEVGIGFKTVGEAIHLRNHVLSRLDLASGTDDPRRRRAALTFVFVGGGYAGVEAFAELEDMARDALRFYPGLAPEDMRWVLVEATGRILPEVSLSLGEYTVERLRERGMEVQQSERARLWERAVQRYPVVAHYQRKSGREVPVVILGATTRQTGEEDRREARDPGREVEEDPRLDHRHGRRLGRGEVCSVGTARTPASAPQRPPSATGCRPTCAAPRPARASAPSPSPRCTCPKASSPRRAPTGVSDPR